MFAIVLSEATRSPRCERRASASTPGNEAPRPSGSPDSGPATAPGATKMLFAWPKKLQTKFLLGLTAITFAGGLLFAAALYYHMRALLETEAKGKAELVLSQAQAVQGYVRTVLRPEMYDILPDDEFMLKAMSSSYVSRRIMENVELEGSAFTYRRVAVNARNPRFEATPREVRLIEHFQQEANDRQWAGIETFKDGVEYFCVARPVVFRESCLHCHGTPEEAPRQLIERYGDERGFGRSAGEVMGLTEVLVPMSTAMIDVRGATMGSVSFAMAGALFCFAVANVLFNRLVVHNLRRLAQVFPKYFSKQAETSLLERLDSGNEIEEVMHSVEDLARHLSQAQSELSNYAVNLRQMVDERTADLWQEASDRRRDVELFVQLLHALNRSHTRRELIQNSLPGICERYGLRGAAFVCTFASQNYYAWPDQDRRPDLPENWQLVVAEAKPLFFSDAAYIPVQPQRHVVEGILCLFWSRDSFDPQRVGDVLIALGRLLGVAMDNLNFQDRLLQQNAMLQSIFEGISDPLFLLDSGGSALLANHAARSLSGEEDTGPAPDENGPGCDPDLPLPAPRKGMEALFGKGAEDGRLPALQSVLQQDTPTSFDLQTLDERSFTINVYPVQGRQEGQQGRLIVYARENTAEKRMLARIQQHEKQATVGRLAAGLAHEINNPLGVILTYAELLQTNCKDSQDCADVEVILQHTRKAQKVLYDLLHFARPRQLSPGPCDIAAVARSVADVFSVQAEARRISLEVRTAPDLPMAKADPVALEQIFSNLLLNALDAAPAQSGVIVLEVACDKQSDLLRVTVTDNGPGIPPRDMDRIFDPFFTPKEVGKGTGLGLAVIYGLLQDMNGRIDVRNAPAPQGEAGHGGAVFTLQIPTAPPPKEENDA